jgi:hypothetical protein
VISKIFCDWPMFSVWRLSALCLFVVSLTGCHSDQLPTHAVDGIVRFDDGSSPMFGDIEFYNAQHKLNARGIINRDGTFTVGTYQDGDGAVEGLHQVVIIQLTGNYLTAKLNDRIKHDHGELVDPKAFDYRTSDLDCTVAPGTNRIELEVRKYSRQSSEGMPEG